MRREAKAIIQNTYHICAYIRNLSREEAWALSSSERDVLISIIKDKLDTLSKSKSKVNLL
jgi:hypothetical protein